MNNFITISMDIQSEITVKKSKFICTLIKVNNQKEAELKIKEIKKKYYDARHNCVAYRIYEDGRIIEKANDDGEPSGTAGGPMLNVLKNNNLCNIVAIVTRYFGGILLGTGGLVRAYTDSIQNAIEISEKLQIFIGEEYEVILDYSNLENFKHYCKINDFKIDKVQYKDSITCSIYVEENKKDKLLEDYAIKKININTLKFLSKILIDKSIIK